MAGHVTGVSNSNATLAYTTATDAYSHRTRVRGVGSGWTVLATESHARLHRAMYPMQKTMGPFSLVFDLKGYGEFRALMDFLMGYAGALLGTTSAPGGTPSTTPMTVAATTPRGLDNFFQMGIPIEGMADGDHVGSMVFSPTITFMPVLDPSDPEIFTNTTGTRGVSWENFTNTNAGDASKFYFPRAAGSVDPGALSQSLYDVSTLNPQLPEAPNPVAAEFAAKRVY